MSVRETSVYSYPRGDVMTSLRTLVDQLNRKARETGTGTQAAIETLQAAVTALEGEVDTIAAGLDLLDGEGPAQQAFLIGLITASAAVVGSVESRIAELKEANEAAARALITEIVRGREDGALVRVEQAVRETETSSLATQITTLSADLDNTAALIVAEQTARVDGDSALAGQIETVSTALNGNVTQVQTIQQSVDGLSGLWGVTVNTNGFVTGMVSLLGGVTGSKFRVEVDQFEVAAVGSERVVPFFIDTTTSPPTIVLNGNIIAPGSILAGSIAAGSITADQIAANSITSNEIDTDTLTVKRVLSANGKLDINALGDPYIRIAT